MYSQYALLRQIRNSAEVPYHLTDFQMCKADSYRDEDEEERAVAAAGVVREEEEEPGG